MSVSISGVGSITGIDQGFNITGGNVGIGTLFPENNIHIKNGSATIKLTSTDAATSARLILESEDDSYGGVHFGDPSDEDAGRIRYYHGGSAPNHMQFTTNGTEKLRITSDGKIGINQSTPTAKLQVTGGGAYTVANSGRSVEGIDINSSSGDVNGAFGGAISFGVGQNGRSAIAAVQNSDDEDNTGLAFFTHPSNTGAADAVERVRITSGGLVGINTASPTATLEIVDSKIKTWTPASTTELLVERDGNCTVSIIGKSDANCQLAFGDEDDENAGYIDYDHANNSMAFRTNAVERLGISSTGEVAMKSNGTPTDALASLHVQNGTFRVSQADGPTTEYYKITTHTHNVDADRHLTSGVSNGTVYSYISKGGRIGSLNHHYAGYTRSDADTPTNYYAHGSFGYYAYSGRSDSTSAFRSVIYTRAWGDGDDGDRNIIYYCNSGSDTSTVDIDADQKFGVKADGQVQGLRRWFSGRVESDEADPDSVYNSDRGGIYGYDSSGTAVMYMLAEAGGSSSTFFVFGRTSNNDTQWKHRTSDGRMYVDASSTTFSGADYAEYFEWSDGNSSDEDRAGYTVVLKDEGKIGIATAGDSPSSIIGVISAAPAIIGDGQDLSWRGKWKKDEFGREITTPVQYLVWNHGFEKDENGNKVPVKQPDPTHQISMENADSMGEVGPKLDKMIADGLVPQFAIDNNIIMNATRRVYDPLYDETKKYVPREFRKEWSPVGLVGKLIVRKGQVMGDRWIKMKDINDQLEQWMVR